MVIKVLIADDHWAVRDGLRCLLEHYPEIQVVAAVADGRQAMEQAARLAPQVVLMDMTMPVLNGIEATRAIARVKPVIGVIMYSIQESSGIIRQAIQAGARGYLTKRATTEEVVKAVRAVAAGQWYFVGGVAERIFGAIQGSGSQVRAVDSLTPTEREIVRMVVDGNTNAAVAAVLKLSRRTVETYRIRLMRKLEVDDLPSLVKFAIRHGLTSFD